MSGRGDRGAVEQPASLSPAVLWKSAGLLLQLALEMVLSSLVPLCCCCCSLPCQLPLSHAQHPTLVHPPWFSFIPFSASRVRQCGLSLVLGQDRRQQPAQLPGKRPLEDLGSSLLQGKKFPGSSTLWFQSLHQPLHAGTCPLAPKLPLWEALLSRLQDAS